MSNRKKLTIDEKTNYLRIGLNLAGLNTDNKTSELIVRLYEGIMEKGGNFSIMDSAMIEAQVIAKYDKSKLKPKTDTENAAGYEQR